MHDKHLPFARLALDEAAAQGCGLFESLLPHPPHRSNQQSSILARAVDRPNLGWKRAEDLNLLVRQIF
jgi:hypothetical protein